MDSYKLYGGLNPKYYFDSYVSDKLIDIYGDGYEAVIEQSVIREYPKHTVFRLDDRYHIVQIKEVGDLLIPSEHDLSNIISTVLIIDTPTAINISGIINLLHSNADGIIAKEKTLDYIRKRLLELLDYSYERSKKILLEGLNH